MTAETRTITLRGKTYTLATCPRCKGDIPLHADGSMFPHSPPWDKHANYACEVQGLVRIGAPLP